MHGSRSTLIPYFICIGLLALLGSSWAAATAAPAIWNDFAVLNFPGIARDLSSAFLLALLTLGCVLAALLEFSLRDPIA